MGQPERLERGPLRGLPPVRDLPQQQPGALLGRGERGLRARVRRSPARPSWIGQDVGVMVAQLHQSSAQLVAPVRDAAQLQIALDVANGTVGAVVYVVDPPPPGSETGLVRLPRLIVGYPADRREGPQRLARRGLTGRVVDEQVAGTHAGDPRLAAMADLGDPEPDPCGDMVSGDHTEPGGHPAARRRRPRPSPPMTPVRRASTTRCPRRSPAARTRPADPRSRRRCRPVSHASRRDTRWRIRNRAPGMDETSVNSVPCDERLDHERDLRAALRLQDTRGPRDKGAVEPGPGHGLVPLGPGTHVGPTGEERVGRRRTRWRWRCRALSCHLVCALTMLRQSRAPPAFHRRRRSLPEPAGTDPGVA